MQYHHKVTHTIDLDDDQRFRGMERYGSDDTEVLVDQLVSGSPGSWWAKGYKIRQDGEVGTARRMILLDTDQLPTEVLVHIVNLLCGGEVS